LLPSSQAIGWWSSSKHTRHMSLVKVHLSFTSAARTGRITTPLIQLAGCETNSRAQTRE
jgi:hypothetical protein